jgi:hypothetical protein
VRILSADSTGRNVALYQQFLQEKVQPDLPVTGVFDAETEQATKTFQEKHDLKQDGIVGPITLAKVRQSDPTFKEDVEIFEIGPDCKDDLRESRPYFLIPLDKREWSDPVLERVINYVDQNPPFSDVYVISHGWHRNFFDAVAVYDRLLSRLIALMHRGRITAPPNYNPLFLCMHWHSDPGADNWYDPNGRRDKASFLQKAAVAFTAIDPDKTCFTNDFEDMYEFFTRLSAPGTDKFGSWRLYEIQNNLSGRFDAYKLTDAAGATTEEKIVVAWRCFEEALPKRVLIDQNAPAGAFMGFNRAVGALTSFAVATVGIAALAGIFAKPLWHGLHKYVLSPGIKPLYTIPGLSGLAQLPFAAHCVLLWIVCMPFAWAFLKLSSNKQDETKTETKAAENINTHRGSPLLIAIAWILLEVPMALIVFVFCLITYLSGLLLKSWLLFDERRGERDKDPLASDPPSVPFREKLIGIARWPIDLMKAAVPTDSSLVNIGDTIDRQLATCEMQRKGVESGGRAAEFIQALFAAHPYLASKRLHMLGHSYGCVVVANAARQLAFGTAPVEIQTLCTVQGAMAANWYDGEKTLLSKVKVLAAVFTRYDTATGFLYSFGYQTRLGLGSVGLYIEGEEIPRYGSRGEFASLTKPPCINPAIKLPCKMSLDASRLEYEGNPAAGGGHDDIFKDDVVNLLWSVTNVGSSADPCSAPPVSAVVGRNPKPEAANMGSEGAEEGNQG